MSYNLVNPTTGDLTRVAGGTLYADNPIGSIIPFGSSTIPSGYLLCNGQAVSRTAYSELFAAIGTAFGTGDGSTTFNVPDLREATTKGAGLSGKSNNHYDADGVALGEFIEDRLQAHTHSNKTGSSTAGSEEWTMFATSQVLSGTAQTDYGVMGRFGNTTEVKAVGVNYIIKAKHVGIPADFIDAVEDVEEISGDTNGIIYHVRKNNAVVCIDLEGTLTSIPEGVDLLLANLPQTFIPHNIVRGALLMTPTDQFAGSINVSTEGRLILYRDQSTLWQGTNYAGSVSYII